MDTFINIKQPNSSMVSKVENIGGESKMKANEKYYVMNNRVTHGKYNTLEKAIKGLKETRELWKDGWNMVIVKGGASVFWRRAGLRTPNLQKEHFEMLGVIVEI